MGLSALACYRASTILDSLCARRGAYFFTVDVVRYRLCQVLYHAMWKMSIGQAMEQGYVKVGRLARR